MKGPVRRALKGVPESFWHRALFPALSRQAASRYRRVGDRLLPHTVSLETHTLCNGRCTFCLASVQNNPRGRKFMPREVFSRCVEDLKALNYSGRLAFFVNNEPLLDKRIVDFVAHARSALPRAYLQISTNGINLEHGLARELLDAGLDDLTVNSYGNDGKIRPNVEEAVAALSPSQRRRVRTFSRQIDEELTNRAGTAPNKSPLKRPIPAFCTYPFTQINIVHDGSVPLCCYDLLAREVMGKVMEEGLMGVWFGKGFRRVRAGLLAYNRRCTALCRVCDWRGFKGLTGPLAVFNPLMRHFR